MIDQEYLHAKIDELPDEDDVGDLHYTIKLLQSRIEAGLEIVEWLADLHDDMHEYGGQTWSKQLAPKLDELRERLLPDGS